MNAFYERISRLSPKRLALLAMDLQSQIETLQTKTAGVKEPIAIVGVGCRFPGGGSDTEKFWRMLRNGQDCISEIPSGRWQVEDYYHPDPDMPGKMSTRYGGFLQNVDLFDASFFGIAPREANDMDPQQRLLLEVAWEALENAAIPADSLRGSSTGVYIGICGSDYLQMVLNGDPDDIGMYSATGNSHSVAAGRLAYILGLQGPAYAIDTACSSSLAAVHLACKSLLMNECRLALAGGVNLILAPEATITLSKIQMMAPDGRCKAFDAAADGFVRGEGCGIVLLKRLSHALKDGNRIVAVIRGSAVNQDGRSNGLTAPNGPAQEAVIRAALRDSGMAASDIGYVECHGTGTALGDPIEVQALAAVLGEGRSPENPLMIGSVKSNIGHLEAAAGIAGLIKTVLCLERQGLPPSLHFHNPNPHIAWERLPVKVTMEYAAWISKKDCRAAGVSSFGFSGTNAHMILEEAPAIAAVAPQPRRPLHPLCLSARSRSALQVKIEQFHAFLNSQKTDSNPAFIEDIAFTLNAGRSHHDYRLFLKAKSSAGLSATLDGLTLESIPQGVSFRRVETKIPPRLAFLFTGQGSQYAGMGRDLYETQPVFRDALERCSEILAPILGTPLLSVIYPESSADALLDQTAYTQPALFALEYALAQLWASWGIRPSVVMGHSVGEYVAACVAGVFSLEEGLRLVAERGRLIQSLPAGGAMAAVFADAARVQKAVEARGGLVSVAAVNGPNNTVLSGERGELATVLAALEAEGMESQYLTVSHAFHSALMDPVLDRFEQAASEVKYGPPQVDVVSNLTGQLAGVDRLGDPGYWRRHMRSPVQFEAGMRELKKQGVEVFVEVGPHPVLLGMGRGCVPDDYGVWLPSLRRGQKDWGQLLESLGHLYLQGITPDWSGFDAPYARKPLALPTYPFERERYWLKQRVRSGHKDASVSMVPGYTLHPLIDSVLETAKKETIFSTRVDCARLPYLSDHRVFDLVVLPAPLFIAMVMAAAVGSGRAIPRPIADMTMSEPLVLPDGQSRDVQLIFADGDGQEADFQIFSKGVGAGEDSSTWSLHVSGKIGKNAAAAGQTFAERLDIAALQTAIGHHQTGDAYYRELEGLGVAFGPAFQGVQELWRGQGKALGRLKLPEALAPEPATYALHPVLLDAAFQTLGAAMPAGADQPTYLMIGFEELVIEAAAQEITWAFGEIRPGARGGADVLLGDIRLLNAQGEPRGRITGMRLKRARREALISPSRSKFSHWLYSLEWKPQVPDNPMAGTFAERMPAPSQVANRICSAVDQWDRRFGLDAYQDLIQHLEAASVGYILAGLQSLGLSLAPDMELDRERLMEQLGVQTKYSDLLVRLIDILVEEQIVARRQGAWRVQTVPAPEPYLQHITTARENYPQFDGEVEMLTRCGARLAQVLRGEQDPLQLLFPRGSMAEVEKLTQTSPMAQAYNGLIQQTTALLLESRPAGTKLRILEIGAGTGGTTSAVLPLLSAETAEYAFTDVAQLFLSKARQKFADHAFVHYGILDIEKEPVSQGFASGSFDMVIAANVLHATASLKDALGHIRRLLAPGGLLVLLEGSAPQRWVDLTFGLTDGWWRFSDREVRPAHPLVDANRWLQLLTEEGFGDAGAIPSAGDADQQELPKQTLLLARAPQESTDAAAARDARPAPWVLVAQSGDPAARLARMLRASGQECLVVSQGAQYRPIDAQQWEIDGYSADSYGRFFRGAGLDKAAAPVRVLHLQGPEGVGRLPEAAHSGCRSALALMQALIQGAWTQKPRLWLVTAGAQAAHLEASHVAVAQAPVWGLGRTMAQEHPEFWGGLVDLGGPATDEELASLIAEVRRAGVEDQVLLRGDKRYVGRLVRHRLERSADGAALFSPDATYLITGGLGGMGLKLAEWMVGRGAANLMLMGRSGPSPAAQALIEQWRARGATVYTAAADVSVRSDLQRVLELIQRSMPPLRGVLHLAGIFEDRVLSGHTWDRFERVFAPKVSGAWLLHEMTRDLPLEHFVLFSSAASFLAPVGLGNYAAANAFLDALAHYRRLLGLPAVSIDWGPWAKTGMAQAVGEAREAQWTQGGFKTMTVSDALALLGDLLRDGCAQAAVLAVEWGKYLERFGAGKIPALFRDLDLRRSGPAAQKAPAGEDAAFQSLLENTHPAERLGLIMEKVCFLVGAVLDLKQASAIEPQTGFFDLGMDSLTAVELKNRLQAAFGQSLSSTVVFDHPTAESLARHLVGHVCRPEGAAAGAPGVSGGETRKEAPGPQREELSEDQLASLLAAKLQEMEP